ncbi:MAG TPA: energy-coupling factor transporter transmembrane component T, partial [Terriglobales bacterium]|nr:energy-coupling factor transporter transmembrane component T [Terriglobales bacterium]
PVFVDSALTVIQAQRSRGFAFERGNLLERGRRYVPVIVPVFIGALRRADGMAMALEARGFQRRTPRSSYGRYLWQVADGAVIAVSVGVAGGYFVLWQLGHTSAAMVPF